VTAANRRRSNTIASCSSSLRTCCGCPWAPQPGPRSCHAWVCPYPASWERRGHGRVGVAAGAPPRTDPDMVRSTPAEETMGVRLHAADHEASDAAFTGLVGWVVQLVAAFGPFGVGLLLAIDNVFPSSRARWCCRSRAVSRRRARCRSGSRLVRQRSDRWSAPVSCTSWVAGSVPSVPRRAAADPADRRRGRRPSCGLVRPSRRRGGVHGSVRAVVRSLVSLPAGTEGMGAVRFGVLTAWIRHLEPAVALGRPRGR